MFVSEHNMCQCVIRYIAVSCYLKSTFSCVCVFKCVCHVYVLFRSINYKKLLEYLFWVYDPELPGGATEMERVLEEGFMDPDMLKV